VAILERLVCLGGLLACFILVFPFCGFAKARTNWPGVVPSVDGTPISYEVYGEGGSERPVLVFVHGWSGDARYWRFSAEHFAKNYKVVLLDLAGHGHSGSGRSDYTMKSFGEDVQVVVQAVGAEKTILIGHSMGGSAIAEAARLMPDRVVGLVGVDALENVEFHFSPEQKEQMLTPFRQDFSETCRNLVGTMVSPDTDPQLREWIIEDMAAAPPAVVLSSLENMLSQYVTGEAAAIFKEIPLPVVAIKGSLAWPTNYEGNLRYMRSFDDIVLEEGDHFFMLNRPEEFNMALEQALDIILNK